MILFGYLVIFFMEKVAFDHHGLLHDMEAEQKNVMPPSSLDEVRSDELNHTALGHAATSYSSPCFLYLHH